MNGKCPLMQTNVSSLQEQKTQKAIMNTKYFNQNLEKVPHSKYLGVALMLDLKTTDENMIIVDN